MSEKSYQEWQQERIEAKKNPLLMLRYELPSHQNGGYGTIKLYPVYLNPENSKPRNYSSDYDGFSWLDNLTVSAQANKDQRESKFYGWQFLYHEEFRVDEKRANTMLKALRRIKRKLDKMNQELGYPETFTVYVARFAKAIGAKRAIRSIGEARSLYSESSWHIADIPTLLHWINEAEQEIAEKLNK